MLARTLAAALGFAVLTYTVGGWHTRAADEPKAEKVEPKRKPWVTSKVTGSPEPPPKYKAVRAFPDVKLKQGLLIARAPGTDRLFVGEREGGMYSIKPGPGAKAEPFCDLKKEIRTIDKLPGAGRVNDLYGLAFHPKFEENRICYVCYTLGMKDGRDSFPADGTRVSRFKVTKTDPPRLDTESEEIVLTWQGGGHNGGDLHFGPDGYLYISSGDGRGPNPPDPLNTGQDCSDLLSSVLRIDVNNKDPGKQYAVPKDNPFVGMKDVRPEIWAYGFRNPYRMSFDRQTGDLWVGDVGWELWEMVYKIERGGNYGWSINEGRQPVKTSQKIGPTPIRPPTIELPHTIAASVTGGYVYRGKKFPELVGAYIFGDWETRRVWAARFEDGRLKEMPEIIKPNIRVVAFGEDHAGELYFLDYDTGFMHTLERNDGAGANTKFPTKLSETGLFADVAKHTPAEGVVPFSPKGRQWQDGATSQHFVALPGTSSVRLFEKPRPLPGQVYWHNFSMHFPAEAVLVKTISIDEIVVGKAMVSRRIETQILHYDGEDWRGYSYLWRDDQSDADLVPPDGTEKVLSVATVLRHDRGGERPGVVTSTRELLWTVPSRTQCLVCHNAWSEYALAFSPRQLDLAAHTQVGLIQRVSADDKALPPFDEAAAAKEPTLVNWVSREADTTAAARSYLHVNCSHCHRFGGGGGQVVLELDFSRPLKETGLLNAIPRQGDFGITDGRLIVPGEPYKSVLFYRMAKFGRGRMPHLGSEYPDPRGLDLMAKWISSLSDPPKPWEIPKADASGVATAFDSFPSAWPFARGFAAGRYAERGDILGDKLRAGAAKLEPGLVRDLFEGYLPPDPKGRKLGANPRPASILALTGDAKKGEAMFFAKDLKCANCHKVGDRGTAVGPDLTAIGKTRSRADLLDSLLQPSARVETQFAAYLVRTKDEKTATGLLVKRDDRQLVIRDAENKEHRFAAEDVESVTPSRLSLMPDGQVSALTPQEAADLLEYLATRR